MTPHFFYIDTLYRGLHFGMLWFTGGLIVLFIFLCQPQQHPYHVYQPSEIPPHHQRSSPPSHMSIRRRYVVRVGDYNLRVNATPASRLLGMDLMQARKKSDFSTGNIRSILHRVLTGQVKSAAAFRSLLVPSIWHHRGTSPSVLHAKVVALLIKTLGERGRPGYADVVRLLHLVVEALVDGLLHHWIDTVRREDMTVDLLRVMPRARVRLALVSSLGISATSFDGITSDTPPETEARVLRAAVLQRLFGLLVDINAPEEAFRRLLEYPQSRQVFQDFLVYGWKTGAFHSTERNLPRLAYALYMDDSLAGKYAKDPATRKAVATFVRRGSVMKQLSPRELSMMEKKGDSNGVN